MLDKFLKKSWNPLLFRIIGTVGFLLMLLVLYFGSIKLIFTIESKLVMLIIWTLWWPFLYITLFFLGRFWCGFLCPVGLANEVGTWMKKRRRDPLLKYGFILFVLFFIIVFWEQVSGLFSSTEITMVFLFTFLISAFVIGILLPRLGFCKHFCPIGALFTPFSRLSLIGVRTNQDICDKCETKECIRGGKCPPCPMFNYVPNLQTNKDCLLCINCIKNCPHNSAKLCFVKPGEEIEKQVEFTLAESLFVVALLGFGVLLTSKGTQFVRFFEANGFLLRAMDFIIWIGFFIGAYFLITYFYTKIEESHRSVYPKLRNKGAKNFKKNLIKGGYVYLPLAFSLLFFSIVFGFITPLTSISEFLGAISKYLILFIGIIWSLKITRKLFPKKSTIYKLSIILIGLLWVLVLIPGPLNISLDNLDVYIVEDKGIVEMTAFSMGFDPAVIRIKDGEYFDIDISNVDIVHSFDLDELGIHVNLGIGESKVIRVNVLEKGEYEYYCAIPGHREAGMKGILIVE